MTKFILYATSLLLAILLPLSTTVAQNDSNSPDDNIGGQQDGNGGMSQELTRYVELMESYAGTKDAILYCDSAYQLASKENMHQICNYALTQKMTNCHFLGLYEQTIYLADSIISMHKDEPDNAYNLYYATYLKIVTYIEQNKFKSAIQLAQKMYEDSKNINTASGELDPMTLYLNVRCNSLMGLGLANNAMGRHEEAIQNYTEGIELAKQDTTQLKKLLGQEIELETYRMQAAQKMKDKKLALEYVEKYDKELVDFEKNKVNTPFENIFIEDFRLFMHNAYADIFTDINRLKDAEKHIKASNDILTTYQLADETRAELNLIKAKYYDKKGEYKSAVNYADSAANYYASVNKLSDEVTSLRTMMISANKMGLYNSIFPVASKILQLTDTINEQRYNSQIEDMQTVMNVDKLEQKTNSMRKKPPLRPHRSN